MNLSLPIHAGCLQGLASAVSDMAALTACWGSVLGIGSKQGKLCSGSMQKTFQQQQQRYTFC